MLRPERMSRVSVTGSKRVMGEAVEVLHDLDLIHLSEYEGSIEGFDPGTSMEGADEASEQLVTIRSLKSILGVTEAEAGPSPMVPEDDLEAEIEEIRQEVNELDDRRDEIEDDLRDVEEAIERLSLFVDLGIDLDLLSGYDNLEVAVGEGQRAAVDAALANSDIEEYEVFGGEEAVAAFARVDDRDPLEEALVGATFTGVEVPDTDSFDVDADGTDPSAYREQLRQRQTQLESKLDTVRAELDDLRLEVGGFLLAAEEQLTIEARKREAPLSFATTANAFVAEGWLPTREVSTLETAMGERVGDSVAVDELERADYDDEGHAEEPEPVEREGGGGGTAVSERESAEREPVEAAADGGEPDDRRTAADGGYVPLANDDPPVVQDNPTGVKPFEALVEIINRPKYSELDPTVVLFLTFPAFFGFMIGDLGYGLLYMGLGYWLLTSFDSDVIKSLGGIGLWAGGFTALFGVLYGEVFGLHQLGEIVWGGHPPIHKGLQPHFVAYAQAWLLASVVVAVFHLVLGRVFDFVNNLSHGAREAFVESGSWILMTSGLWLWVFSRQAPGPKPTFMFRVFAREGAVLPFVEGSPTVTPEQVAIPLGFTGLPEVAGTVGLAMLVVGLVLGFVAEGGIVIIESITQAFGHVVSYTRLAAVLLAKAGMALAVNLLVFGATLHDGEFHFIFFMSEKPTEHVVFQGLFWPFVDPASGPVALVLGLIGGLLILVVGHALVLVLGITSAGLQAIRLEYVEFFGKFYEGGGSPYNPFGYERTYTTEE